MDRPCSRTRVAAHVDSEVVPSRCDVKALAALEALYVVHVLVSQELGARGGGIVALVAIKRPGVAVYPHVLSQVILAG